MLRSRANNPNKKFDQGFLAIGAVLLGLLVVALFTHVADFISVDVMTIMLWLSVGTVMVLSRLNQGRWE
ncbi:MAG: hypothetical protein C7B47_11920 [Sulfobacillus thermosulfidooxidans]|uniref:Uncharacterized protein n=1 Tax=Sulfobacillus thermosulfidooxidans TaxID=28034 RepID=A0A2T2WTL3_SULTH|nr:MAG: hypothetical protein C7B47_11920 [Sulfobacillus thermosulfidooxidans]